MSRDTMRWLGKKAAEYHRPVALPPKRTSTRSKTVKVDVSQPAPTPDISNENGSTIQPAQRYGRKVAD